jgi:hypothetical protein
MLTERVRKRLAAETKFIEPCLPSPADKPPSGSNWIHEIKHDGYRLMARRDPVGIRLLTRNGNDWTTRYPLVSARPLTAGPHILICGTGRTRPTRAVADCRNRSPAASAFTAPRCRAARSAIGPTRVIGGGPISAGGIPSGGY